MPKPCTTASRDLIAGRARPRCLPTVFALVVLSSVLVGIEADLRTAGGTTEVTIGAVADARVLAASPSTNHGSYGRLDVDSPGEQSYLRFTVAGVSGVVQRATLRLFVDNGSSNGPKAHWTTGGWTEATITWDNRPPATSAAIADVGSMTSGTWAELDLTGDVTGDGTYDIVLLPDSSDGAGFDSREGGWPPQLVLTLDDGSPPVNEPPVATDDRATTTDGATVDIDVAANDQDPDGVLDRASANTACATCSTTSNGALVDDGDGTFRYTGTAGFTGTDGFTYEICDDLGACDTATVDITIYPTGGGSEVFVGAGDIASCSRSTDEATAKLLDGIPGTVFTIGDNAYPNGSASDFTSCYGPTWGRHKARTRPSIGDGEYDTPGALPYFDYFGVAAGAPGKGYYSYDLGAWHVIHLNSECSKVGGCRPSSPQGQWLQEDLAAHPRACILAIHHEPLFSSKGGDSDLRDLWTPLHAAGADVVLSGHRHNYERFAPQTPSGVADSGGIRQFVVGTGGTSLSSFKLTVAANSQVRNDRTHGVLKLTLHPTGYEWQFVPVAGRTFTDSGSASC
jgi:hypothetical protein